MNKTKQTIDGTSFEISYNASDMDAATTAHIIDLGVRALATKCAKHLTPHRESDDAKECSIDFDIIHKGWMMGGSKDIPVKVLDEAISRLRKHGAEIPDRPAARSATGDSENNTVWASNIVLPESLQALLTKGAERFDITVESLADYCRVMQAIDAEREAERQAALASTEELSEEELSAALLG